MKTFHWSYQHVRLELPGAQGWVWYAWAMQSEQGGFGPAYKAISDGYVRQEVKRLMAMVKIVNKK